MSTKCMQIRINKWNEEYFKLNGITDWGLINEWIEKRIIEVEHPQDYSLLAEILNARMYDITWEIKETENEISKILKELNRKFDILIDLDRKQSNTSPINQNTNTYKTWITRTSEKNDMVGYPPQETLVNMTPKQKAAYDTKVAYYKGMFDKERSWGTWDKDVHSTTVFEEKGNLDDMLHLELSNYVIDSGEDFTLYWIE